MRNRNGFIRDLTIIAEDADRAESWQVFEALDAVLVSYDPGQVIGTALRAALDSEDETHLLNVVNDVLYAYETES